jgi:hypothetical protein
MGYSKSQSKDREGPVIKMAKIIFMGLTKRNHTKIFPIETGELK